MQLATLHFNSSTAKLRDALNPHDSLGQALFLSEAGTVKIETVHAAEGQSPQLAGLQLASPQTGSVILFVKGQGFLFNSQLDLEAMSGESTNLIYKGTDLILRKIKSYN